MAVDYAKKLEEIHNDYYSTVAKFLLVEKSIQSADIEIKPTDDERQKLIKESLKKEILIDLGRVGEMAFKYLIKLEQLNCYPNQPLEQFRNDVLFKKGPLTNYGKNKGLSDTDLEPLTKYSDVNKQPFHNFDYLFSFIEILMPDVANKFNKTIEYRLTSNMIKEMPGFSTVDNEYIVFPEETHYSIIDEKIDQEKRDNLKLVRRNTISKSGDIFTRLRYFANDPQDKTFDVNEIYELMKDVMFFINMIYISNDNLNVNIELAYAKAMIKENPSLVGRPESEVQEILALPKIKDNPRAIGDFLFYSSLFTLDELKEICNHPNIDPSDYTTILCNGLKKDIIEFFWSHKIYDYELMAILMVKKDPKELSRLLDCNKYNLSELQCIVKEIEADKYNNLILLQYLRMESIKKLNEYPDLLQYLIDNVQLFEVLPGHRWHTVTEDGLMNLLTCEEIVENPELLYSCEDDQVFIYLELSRYLANNNPVFISHVSVSNFAEDMWLEHIKDNIETFKDSPNLLERLPLLLDADDNKKVLDVLIDCGLDINHIAMLDTTIFCMPFVVFNSIILALKKIGQPIVINNNINPLYFKLLEQMMYNIRGKEKGEYSEHNYQNKRRIVSSKNKGRMFYCRYDRA